MFIVPNEESLPYYRRKLRQYDNLKIALPQHINDIHFQTDIILSDVLILDEFDYYSKQDEMINLIFSCENIIVYGLSSEKQKIKTFKDFVMSDSNKEINTPEAWTRIHEENKKKEEKKLDKDSKDYNKLVQESIQKNDSKINLIEG